MNARGPGSHDSSPIGARQRKRFVGNVRAEWDDLSPADVYPSQGRHCVLAAARWWPARWLSNGQQYSAQTFQFLQVCQRAASCPHLLVRIGAGAMGVGQVALNRKHVSARLEQAPNIRIGTLHPSHFKNPAEVELKSRCTRARVNLYIHQSLPLQRQEGLGHSPSRRGTARKRLIIEQKLPVSEEDPELPDTFDRDNSSSSKTTIFLAIGIALIRLPQDE